MKSDNPIGAENQQGSPDIQLNGWSVTPQRLHAELLAVGAKGLEAYLQGALHDGTRSARHGTHRIGQSDPRWLDVLAAILEELSHRSWRYREGKSRDYWVLETSARFLDVEYDASELVGSPAGRSYVRGYFDAEGGMPKNVRARLYIQLSQKNRTSLEILTKILEAEGIACGRLHQPSAKVDPDYWRFYVRSRSHEQFMRSVGSWHPRKRQQIAQRLCAQDGEIVHAP